MKHIILYLVSGTRGGETRGRIIESINKKPCNAHKLSKRLDLDYKTITHHLDILVDNGVFKVLKKGKYGAMYFISEEMEKNWEVFEDIWKRFGN